MTTHDASFMTPILIFCAGAVIAVPLFKRAGLGAVIGYLAAGLAIGPSGFGLFTDAATVSGVAELGIVLLLFVIGLELKFSTLVAMRRDIFGLGLAQFAVTAAVIGLIAYPMLARPQGAVLIGIAFAMSATAIALQILDERGTLQTSYGQRTFAVLLFQDMAIVPILALVPLLATGGIEAGQGGWREALVGVGKAVGAIALIVLAGRYLLNPFFRVLAMTGAREVLTAAALLVVLGSAFAMQFAGMSMALGAFLAGLLLAESNFRHQLEADIEPFRGLLLGLFFMSVGMGMDASLIGRNWLFLALAAPALVAIKIGVAYLLERWLQPEGPSRPRSDALRSSALLAPAGEFSYVLLPLAGASGILNAAETAVGTAIAALTMVLGPIAAKLLELRIVAHEARKPAPDFDPADFDGVHGSVLVIGFGRFGQLTTQVLLADDVDVTVIDNNVSRIQQAARFGFKVYYGDGTRLDVLRAAGAANARVIAVCVDGREDALTILELAREHFPLAQVHVRAFDRIHAVDLLNGGADFQIRETLLSALEFGRQALVAVGVDRERANEVQIAVRERDEQRLAVQLIEGKVRPADYSGVPRFTPEPLSQPRARSKALSAETEAAIGTSGPAE